MNESKLFLSNVPKYLKRNQLPIWLLQQLPLSKLLISLSERICSEPHPPLPVPSASAVPAHD